MSRFNKGGIPQVGPRSAVTATEERVVTFEGMSAYKRTPKGELFLLAASFMGGDDNFYEKEQTRYKRLTELIRSNEVITDGEWLWQFVNWLRNDAQMRTVSMVVALEAVRTRVVNGMTDPFNGVIRDITSQLTNRDIVSAALARADEPAEALAYWLHKYGKPIPQPVKNGVADAARRLYNEFSFLKYGDQKSAALNMRDVLRLVHVEPRDGKQNALFEFIVGKGVGAGPENLPVINNRNNLYSIPRDERRQLLSASAFKVSGMTWENVSEWIPGGMDGAAWDAIIPNMGVMALIRNLRNFDEAGISRESARYVEDQIRSPEVVRKSRQLPFRWYNAYRAVDSVRWSTALDEALTYSLVNIPKLRGNTLVLVDMSGSMFQSKVSPKSNVLYADVATLFGSALKLANPHGVHLYQFGSDYGDLVDRYIDHRGLRYGPGGNGHKWSGVTKEIDIRTGGSVLRAMEKFHDMGGTELHRAVAETVKPEHDRVIILTDEQAFGSGFNSWINSSVATNGRYDDLPVPANKNVYIWNLGGYEAGVVRSGRYHRHTFGGLSDSAFKLIPILEAGRNSSWPWTVKDREENGETRGK